jgi:hypothetical protein
MPPIEMLAFGIFLVGTLIFFAWVLLLTVRK